MQQIIRARRSIRRFTREPVPIAVLEDVLEAARLSPTGTNAQPLRFVGVRDPERCEAVFGCLRWAGLIPDGSASPSKESQPSAYVVILVDRSIREQADNDAGAAAMSIMLSAQGAGVASCWLGAIDRPAILKELRLAPERFHVHTVVALGYPAQQSRAVPMTEGKTAYYLEAPDKLCVPKRPADEITSIL